MIISVGLFPRNPSQILSDATSRVHSLHGIIRSGLTARLGRAWFWNAPLDFKKGSGPVVLHSSIHLILLGSAYLCCQIPDGLECAVHKVQLDIPDIRVVAI